MRPTFVPYAAVLTNEIEKNNLYNFHTYPARSAFVSAGGLQAFHLAGFRISIYFLPGYYLRIGKYLILSKTAGLPAAETVGGFYTRFLLNLPLFSFFIWEARR